MAKGKKIQLTDEEFITLYESGLTDGQIAEKIGCAIVSISKIRRKLKKSPNKDTRPKISLTLELLQQYVNEGKNDSEIAYICNITNTTVRKTRQKFGIDTCHPIETNPLNLTDTQKQVIFGSLLGDARAEKQVKNTEISMQHSMKQKEYVDYLTEYFENCPHKVYEFLRKKDKRTGKEYNTYNLRLNSNQSFNIFREIFYPNGVKIIPLKYLEEYYTPLAMAIHFFDDGYKELSGYNISTCSFSREDLEQFKRFLYIKYNLETTITKANRIYIRKCSEKTFEKLILPYTPNCMKYKLHVVS